MLIVQVSPYTTVGDWDPSSDWHHMLIAFDNANNNYYMYTDGVQDSKVSDSDEIPSGNQPFYWGFYESINYYYTGRIDNGSLWNGITLGSEANVTALAQALYNSGTPAVFIG
jgi:hypothetical protein